MVELREALSEWFYEIKNQVWFHFWDKPKRALEAAWWAFFEAYFPEKAWKRICSKLEEDGNIIAFPERIEFEEVVVEEGPDKYIGFECTYPSTYGLLYSYSEESAEPRRRAFRDIFMTLVDFSETDKLYHEGEVLVKVKLNNPNPPDDEKYK